MMNSLRKLFFSGRFVLVLVLLLVAGCGEGTDSGFPVAGDSPSTLTGSGGDASPEVIPSRLSDSNIEWNAWIFDQAEAGLVYLDRDGDGIADSDDSWPDQPPYLRDLDAGVTLEIASARTEIGPNFVSGVAVASERLAVDVPGLSLESGAKTWLVFTTPAGLRALPVVRDGTDRIEMRPPRDVSAVHLVVGSSRGPDYPLQYLGSTDPVLFDHDDRVRPGEEIRLVGRNLSNLTTVLLGDRLVAPIFSGEEFLRLRIPDSVYGDEFIVVSPVGRSNRLQLDIRRLVTVNLGIEPRLGIGEELVFWFEGARHAIDHYRSTVIDTPADQVLTVHFDLATAEKTLVYSILADVIWPGEDSIVVSSSGLLMAHLLSIREDLPRTNINSWEFTRQSLSRGLDTPQAIAIGAAVSEWVSTGRMGAKGALLAAATEAYVQIAGAEIAGQTATIAAEMTTPASTVDAEMTTPASTVDAEIAARAPPTTAARIYPLPNRDLDDYLGSVLSWDLKGPKSSWDLTQRADPVDPAGTDYVFPRETPGNGYSQIVIVPHTDFRGLTVLGNPFSVTCEFMPREVTWAVGKNLWNSDLCIQIDGKVFISASVVKGGFDDFSSVEQTLGNAALSRLRDHAQPEKLLGDNDQSPGAPYIMGPGGHYLKDKNGQPLCRMVTCYVELITSGYGDPIANAPLSNSEEKIRETLQAKMWADILTKIMVGLAWVTIPGIDTDADNEVVKCIQDHFVQKAVTAGLMAKLYAVIKGVGVGSRDEIARQASDFFDQEMGNWLKSYLKGQLGDPFFKSCITDKPQEQMIAAIEANLELTPGGTKLVGEGLKGLEIFNQIYSGLRAVGSVLLTPQKILFKMDPRARVTGLGPRLIDLNDVEGETLTIDGNWIASKEDLNAGLQGWTPALVFEDRFGRRREVPVMESYIGQVPAASQTNQGLGSIRLQIPFNDFSGRMQNLASGELQAWLELPADYDYRSYPDSKLRMPVPDGTLSLLTQPKISGFKPPVIEPGGTLTALGTRLDVYGDTGGRFTLVKTGPTTTPVLLEQVQSPLNNASEVPLRVPEGTPTGEYSLILSSVDSSQPTILASQKLWVTDDNSAYSVSVADLGEFKDDALYVEFFNSNIGLEEYFYVPANASDPQTREFANALPWESGDYLDGRLRYVRIKCRDPGNDKVCSYAARTLSLSLCKSNGSSSVDGVQCDEAGGECRPTADRVGGTLRQDEFDLYELAIDQEPGSDICDAAVFPAPLFN